MFCDKCNCSFEDKGLNKIRHRTGRCAADPDRVHIEPQNKIQEAMKERDNNLDRLLEQAEKDLVEVEKICKHTRDDCGCTTPTDVKLTLWTILVPTERKKSNGVKAGFKFEHHKDWDAHVISITGGVTIHKGAIGYWGQLRERVIPCNIACTEEQIIGIAQFTKEHYQQEAVMFWKISEDVRFV